MKALSNHLTGNGFAADLAKAGRMAAAIADSPRNDSARLRQTVVVPLPPRDRESAMRAFLGTHGLSMPEHDKRLTQSRRETTGAVIGAAINVAINVAIGKLTRHGTVAQGVAHACRTGDTSAFKAVLDLATAKVLDVNAAPGDGKPLLAMLCAADVVGNASQKSIDKRHAIDERIALLAEHHADFGLRDAQGNSFLHLAAAHDADAEVIHALIDYAGGRLKPSDVNADGETALHTGLRAGCSARMVRALFSLGVDLSARDAAGRTALHVAAAHARLPNVLEALLNNGAALHDTCEQGRTVLHHAAMHSDNPGIIALLISRGADPHVRDKDGNTAHALAEARQLGWPVPVAMGG